MGLSGSKFDRVLAEERAFIESTEAKKFHQGLKFLGIMLGAQTHEWDGSAKPDGFWNLAHSIGFVFEAKTEEFNSGSLSIGTVRQALTHEKCVRDDKLLPDFAACHTIVITPRTTIEPEAMRHAGDLLYCSHSELIAMFDKAAAALTELRLVAPTHNQDLLPAEAIEIYRKHGVFGEDVIAFFLQKRLSQMSANFIRT
jgi:hypothetical protein